MTMLSEALAYADRGWAVMPCRPRDKTPAVAHGCKDATTHRPTIIGWWSSCPDFNIGIATGERSGLFVLDADAKPGRTAEEALAAAGIVVPETLGVRTGGGGLQYFFKYPKGSGLSISAGALGLGIDTRGEGGYVVAPPSIHPRTGQAYTWLSPRADVAEMPAGLLAKLKDAQAKKMAPVPPGPITVGRHDALVSSAVQMHKLGFEAPEIGAALTAMRDNRMDETDRAIPDREIAGVVKWATTQARIGQSYPLTDLGNAERLVDASTGDLRWCLERECWYAWDGQRWNDKGEAKAHIRAHEIARLIGLEAEAENDEHKRKAMRTWATKSESAERLTAMVRVAARCSGLHCSVADFDADPWAFNCESGTLNLKTGQLEAHRPSRMCSRLAPVRFVAGARHTTLDAYLDLVTGTDAEFIGFLQRALGYSLTGDVGAEVVFLVLGPGGSGKTTLVEALKEMMGDYAATVAAKTLLAKKTDGGHSSDIARLHGRRMVGASEFEKGERLNAALIKGLTGGERVTARNIYESDFEFRPMAKFWLAANDPPVIDDNDTGMWRRVLKVPFTNVIPAAMRSDAAKGAMKGDPAVRSALLSWALQGCLDWQSRGGGLVGLAPCERITEATKAYQEESNPLAEFLDECCEVGPDKVATVAAVRTAYGLWSRGQAKRMDPKEFNERLGKLGLVRGSARVNGRMAKVWRGLATGGGETSETENDRF